MFNICVLASGSSGNSTAIWTDTTGILIDCGCSRRYIENTLSEIKLDPALLQGIVITHGHSDHIGAATVRLAGAYGIPLFIHQATFLELRGRETLKGINILYPELIRHHTKKKFSIGDLEIAPFTTYHSGCAGESFGFCITYRGGQKTYKAGYITDTGKVDDTMVEALLDCNVLVLEANHDPEMVRNSSRHYLNRKWVLSDYGHLANADAGSVIARIKHQSPGADILKYVFVAHISRQHNTLPLALRQINEKLKEHGTAGIRLLPTYHGAKSAIVKMV
jgi:phosphoribosyl 1,2-cyclic phosphodiesterase